ncbi:hypothetical protein OW763_05185 [Clostridium aestuarii]|uniref:Uncharacterized protein n=1 Tax=Clostridium aestuarii TaxID=338193 RepID=A0ABT4CZD3_9CLOT|nr:hypothetical protein [Clostridium aestuarii]MCY6483742.1 hypothetical protein [Clostridium aestuarii]
MIFTLLVLSLLVIAMLYVFKIEIIKKQDNVNLIKYGLNRDIYENDREHLKYKLSVHIKKNQESLNEEIIKKILSGIDNKDIIYNKSFVKYDLESKNITLDLVSETGSKIKEYYRCEKDKVNNKIRFELVKIEY